MIRQYCIDDTLTEDGCPIGIEIAVPSLVTVEAVNQFLTSFVMEPADSAEPSPLEKAT